MKGLLNICSPLKQKHGKRVERFWSERSWHTPTMKIHRGGNSAGSRLNIWASSKDRLGWGWWWGYKENETNCPFFHFGTLLLVNTTISIWFVCLSENYRSALGPLKNNKKKPKQKLILSFQKGKKQHTRGESICSGMGEGKKKFT